MKLDFFTFSWVRADMAFLHSATFMQETNLMQDPTHTIILSPSHPSSTTSPRNSSQSLICP
jgi:hypothetical protein